MNSNCLLLFPPGRNKINSNQGAWPNISGSLPGLPHISLSCSTPHSVCIPLFKNRSNVTAYEYSACMLSHYHSTLVRGGSNLWVQYVHPILHAAAVQRKRRKGGGQ